ncbi:hypothetical protein CFD26_101139 [Aspergillus turcosus]|uniref:Uncharacterized protein n=1 Tax=Aspergillus turcosus TaxID=1245748 RepID=A0A421CW02_9EURO|nr:hypothetical protein CFD26_101139 [Aspergillus turcosus]
MSLFGGTNTGDDIAGYIHEVGEASWDSNYAEYATGEAYATFHILETTSFEQAATIPLAAMTAALALFSRLGLPEPWFEEKSWARRPEGGVLKADIYPIICVEGRGKDFVRSHLSEVTDYRDGESAVVAAIEEAVPKGKKLRYALDAVSEKASFAVVCQVLDPADGAMSIVSPAGPDECPENIRVEFSDVGRAHKGDKVFAHIWSRFFTLGLSGG